MNSKKKKIAICGLGAQGQALLKACYHIADAQVVAASDIKESAVQEALAIAKQSGQSLQTYLSVQELLSCSHEIDLLCVATQSPQHIELTQIALENGAKRVLVEKPLSNRLGEAYSLLKILNGQHDRVLVNHSRRWSKNYQLLKYLLHSESLGRLIGVSVFFGAGGIGALGVHFIDIIRFLFDEEIIEARADFDLPLSENSRGSAYFDPGGRAFLKFNSGAYVFLDFSLAYGTKHKLIVILAENGRIEFDEIAEKIRVIKKGQIKELSFINPDYQNFERAKTVLEGILLNNEFYSTVLDGIASVEVIAALHLSHKELGASVKLPLKVSDRDIELRIT